MFKAVFDCVSAQKRSRVSHQIEAPEQRGIVCCDKAEWVQAKVFHALRKQQAEGLLRIAPCEAVDVEVGALIEGKRFDKQAVWCGEF